ncbi:hypothetical protein C8R45DRAFT_996435 [Mycena sanguinolenta]|nr:hypothetical protein C8R45DRAFT_996435 [Mycena sanguinolenta]
MHTEAGPGYTLADERSNMLERLNDIPLKGFPEMEETPSSATMSLPTPEAQDVALPPVDTVQALGGSQTVPVSYLFAGDDGILVPPAAPRMKDYDTFTEGTAEGSFNSIPAAETNELGEPIYPISARALAALPLNDATVSIEQWRQGVEDFVAAQAAVVAAEPPPVLVLRDRAQLPTSPVIDLTYESEANSTPTQKRPRPRSNSPDDARRLRRAPFPSPRLRPRAHSFLSASSSILNSFIWVDRAPRPRPPSRANSAPPD